LPDSSSPLVAVAEGANEPAKAGADKSSSDPESGPRSQDAFRYVGTVVDETGRPVEGAHVNPNYWRLKSGPS